MTPTQFAWTCCAAGDFPPPANKKGVITYGPDAQCWLCGGDTHGVGWPMDKAISSNFTDYSRAQCIESRTICQACAATGKVDGWLKYVRAHPERGLPEAFAQKEGKAKRDWNWLYSSHVFRHGHHECPDRKRWRELLLNPPEPPFLAILAVSGKKQVIFKGQISYSRAAFAVQADDERILVRPSEFAQLLADFERLYRLGFSKDSISSGTYNQAQILKIGLSRWRELEAEFKRWRDQPGLLSLAHYCAQRPEDWESRIAAIVEAKSAAKAVDTGTRTERDITPQQGQISLF